MPYTEDTRISLLRFENGAIKPTTYSLDLRAEKRVDLGGVDVSLFLLVYNVLDIKNEYGINSPAEERTSICTPHRMRRKL